MLTLKITAEWVFKWLKIALILGLILLMILIKAGGKSNVVFVHVHADADICDNSRTRQSGQ